MISDGINRLLKIGGNADVVACFVACFRDFRNQPNDMNLINQLRGISTDEACKSIFGYMCNHVDYKLDKEGDQYIKSPARLLTDACGDCKSLTMFVASCLYCLEIPCIIRFVNFDGCGQYTHVYPVAIDEWGNEIPMDMCERDTDGVPLYGFAREYKQKKDINTQAI